MSFFIRFYNRLLRGIRADRCVVVHWFRARFRPGRVQSLPARAGFTKAFEPTGDVALALVRHRHNAGLALMTRICPYRDATACAAEGPARRRKGPPAGCSERLSRRPFGAWPCSIWSRGRSAPARRRRTIRPVLPRSPWPRGSFGTPRRTGHRRRRRDRAGAPSRFRRWSRW